MKPIISLARRALPKNRFARGVSVLAFGTVAAQGLTVLVSPLLTRLYSPHDFGLMAVFTALLSMLAVIAGLRYELAIPLSDSQAEAAALLVLSLLLLVIISGLCAIPILAYREEIARLCNTPELARYLWLAPVGGLFAGAANALNLWVVRNKSFAPQARSKMAQSITMTLAQLGGASFGAAALLGGQSAGHAAASLVLGTHVMRRQWRIFPRVGLPAMLMAARRYKNFPLFSTWSATFNTAGAQLPAVLFAILFGSGAAGIYGLAYRVLSMPMQLLGQAIAHVFFSSAAQAQREGRLADMVARIHRRLAHLGMPPALVLVLCGPQIFQQAFGAQWEQAGVFAQWLAPWLYLVFISSPLAVVFEVLEKQGLSMAFQALALALRIATIAVGACFGDIALAVALFALGNCACVLANMASVIRLAGNAWSEVWRPSCEAFLWALALVSPVIAGLLWQLWHPARELWAPAVPAALVLTTVRYIWLMRNAWA